MNHAVAMPPVAGLSEVGAGTANQSVSEQPEGSEGFASVLERPSEPPSTAPPTAESVVADPALATVPDDAAGELAPEMAAVQALTVQLPVARQPDADSGSELPVATVPTSVSAEALSLPADELTPDVVTGLTDMTGRPQTVQGAVASTGPSAATMRETLRPLAERSNAPTTTDVKPANLPGALAGATDFTPALELEVPPEFDVLATRGPDLSSPKVTADLGSARLGPEVLPVQVSTTPTPTASQPSVVLAAPVGSATWGEDLTARVAWMARQDGGAARLEVSPPELGPVQIKITVNAEQAQVSLNAAHAFTREALEATMDRLRSALAEEGFTEVDVNLGDPREQAGREQTDQWADGSSASEHSGTLGGTNTTGDQDLDLTELRVSRPLGLVDHYA